MNKSIPDNHPLLLQNLQPKAQTSDLAYIQSSVRIVEGSGRLGTKPKPFNYHRAVNSFGSWVYKATMINAKGIGRCKLREFAKVDKRTRTSRDFKTKSAYRAAVASRLEARAKHGSIDNSVLLWDSRPVSITRKKYLNGEGRCKPSNFVQTKVAEYGGDFEEITEQTPELKLLSTVNPWMSGYDLTVLRMIYLQLTGNHYLHPVIDPRLKVPCELWPMPSQWVEIIPDRETFISGYAYGQDKWSARKFLPDEVIHFKQSNPRDLFYGLGNVEAVWDAINLHDSKRVMDTAKFVNHGRPDWLLIVKNGANPDALDRLEEAVDSKLRGASNAGKFLTISGDVDAKALNMPIDEIGDADVIIEEIAAGFDVPITKLKANDPNLASATAADTAWLRDTILPYATMDEERLNGGYLPLFDGNGNSVLAYDNPVPEEEAFSVDRLTKYVAGGILSPNEGRAEIGYGPADGGDNLRMARNVDVIATVPNTDPYAAGDGDGGAGNDSTGTTAPPVAQVDLTAQQINAVRSIVADVTQGTMPRDAGLAILSMSFPLTAEQAEAMMGTAGTNPPPPETPLAPNAGKTVKTAGPHSYSCVMAPIDGAAGEAMKSLADSIPDEDLAEDGRETDRHATVLYGLHDEDHASVADLMKGEPPVQLTLGRTKVFPATEKRPSDVVVCAVESADLERLNAKLATLPHTNSYASYVPHATIAYVKPGMGEKYAGHLFSKTARPVTVATLIHASKSGVRTPITLTGDVKKKFELNRGPKITYKPRIGADGLAGPLPQGHDLAVAIKQYFVQQEHAVLTAISGKVKKNADTDPVDDVAPNEWFSDAEWNARLAAVTRPMLETTARVAAHAMAEQLGADDSIFEVVNRNVPEAVEKLTLKFCDATNATTTLQLDEAKAALKKEISDGYFAGDTRAELVKRVRSVYTLAEKSRATTIAQTETSRAVHDAELISAKASKVVQTKSWLASADACDRCLDYASQGEIPLDQDFDEDSYGPIAAAPGHPNCVLGDTPVVAPGTRKGFAAGYRGPIVRIELAGGTRLACTPNHMLLTRSGFAPAWSLRKGDDVISCPAGVESSDFPPKDNDRPALIHEIVASLSVDSRVLSDSVPATAKDFHGDGKFVQGHIDIVSIDSQLGSDGDSSLTNQVGDDSLAISDVRTVDLVEPSDLASMLIALRNSTDGGMGIFRQSLAFRRAKVRHSQGVGLSLSADRNSGLQESPSDSATGDIEIERQLLLGTPRNVSADNLVNGNVFSPGAATPAFSSDHAAASHSAIKGSEWDIERISDLLKRFPGLVSTLQVIHVHSDHFDGPVYDLETESSLYVANGIVSSNCQCTVTFGLKDLSDSDE